MVGIEGHLLLTTGKAAWFIISVDYVCSVCLSDDNFWKRWRGKFIFARPVYVQGNTD